MFTARGNVCKLDRLKFHIPIVGICCDLLTAVLKYFNLHGVHGLLDDEPLVVALGNAQLQAVILPP